MQKIQLNNILCYVLILFVPFSWINISIGSVYRFASILLFCLWLLINNFIVRIPKKKKSLFYIWTIYIGYTCTSVLWSIEKAESISNIFGMGLLYILSLVFFSARFEEKESKYADFCWMFGTVVLIASFVLGSHRELGLSSRQTLVIMGTSTDANEFGSFFIIGGVVLLRYLLNENKNILKILYSLLFLGSLYVVFMTGSRGALFSFLIAVAFELFEKRTLKKTIYIIFMAILVFALVAMVVLPYIPEANLDRIKISALIKDGGSGRDDIWGNAIDSFVNNNAFRMIFGIGYCRYNFGIETNSGMMMHNQILQQLMSYGIVGLIIYSVLILECWRIFRKEFTEYKSIFVGMMAMSMTITMGPSYKLLWTILFLAMVSKNKSSANN